MNSCQHGEVFEAVVIGTGFAGAATAARLVQAKQRICVLERGRRFQPRDFPMYPSAERLLKIDGSGDETEAPDLARWFWRIDQGLYDVRDLDEVVTVQAAGYGGGSLIYANVHLRPPPDVFERGWPSEYTRARLDPYYDLAACMLEARPMPLRVAKTEQMAKAAASLGRAESWFRPPLAVNFSTPGEKLADAPRENSWGRLQGECDLRGQCCLGCRQQAKNTLDLNYLAIVEDARDDDNRPLADIRTLAEVVRVEPASCDCGARFAVRYRDLVFASSDAQADVEVCYAKHVFLCAGAISTTELLLNSPGLVPEDTKRRVGSRYTANADTIAAVFDCAESQRADLGPTITAALTYRDHADLWTLEFETEEALTEDPTAGLRGQTIRCDGQPLNLAHEPLFDFGSFTEASSRGMMVVSGDGAACRAGSLLTSADGSLRLGTLVAAPGRLEDWLMVQDGGYPTDIEPLLGILRSPLWGRRNRFCWVEPIVRPGARSAATQPAAPAATGQSRFPLPTAVAAVQALPSRPINFSVDTVGTRQPAGLAFGSVQPLALSLDSLAPPWLRDAFAEGRKDLGAAVAPLIDPFIQDVIEDLARKLNRRFDIEALAKRFPGSVSGEIGTLDPETKGKLIQGLLRQTMQILWGSEVGLAQTVNELLLGKVPQDLQGWADRLAPLLGWLLQYRAGNGHTAVLLVMGRDRYRGRLAITGARPRLTARLPSPAADRSRLVHERLLRDIAGAWRGELRTNPVPTFLGRRVTVHSQGGCPMTSDAAARVTESDGRVVGRPGLYVMDAAAFPTAVGVNPSATILAVAEYKVARFIKDVLQKDNYGRCPSEQEVAAWFARHPGLRESLDPFTKAETELKPPRAVPLGIAFPEVMSGLYGIATHASCDELAKQGDADAIDRDAIESFELAERQGAAAGHLISMDVTATIDDLDAFLRLQKVGAALKIPLKGCVKYEDKKLDVSPEQSYMQLFVAPAQDAGKPVRYLRYRLALADGATIEAAKVLQDDARFDAWYDLSTLYFVLFENGAPSLRGIMRLTPQDFVEKQLQQIRIVPDDVDPSRKSWAYFAFVRYFLGEVAAVYLQRTEFLNQFIRNLVNVP